MSLIDTQMDFCRIGMHCGDVCDVHAANDCIMNNAARSRAVVNLQSVVLLREKTPDFEAGILEVTGDRLLQCRCREEAVPVIREKALIGIIAIINSTTHTVRPRRSGICTSVNRQS